VRVTDGSLHVWWADLEAIGDRPEQLLCPAELARAARIVPARKRVLWARSRGMLRALLGRYLDRDPLDLRFALGPHGKPALLPEEGGPATDLRFNLSHSGGLALVAVTAGREVGVDVEVARERYTAEFMHAWVANEAGVKCLGAGLAESLGVPPQDGLWTTQLDVGPGAIAAVAVDGGRCELRSWEWRA
jgi:4'-phosphopantetheinyl transferase